MEHLLIHKVEFLARTKTGTEDGTPTYGNTLDPIPWPNADPEDMWPTFGPGRLDSPREGQPRPGQKAGSIIFKSTLFVMVLPPGAGERSSVRVTTSADAVVWRVDAITPADDMGTTHHYEILVSRIVDA